MKFKITDARVIIFLIYLVPNLIAFILSSSQGNILVESYSFSYESINGVIGFGYVIFSLIFITVGYFVFSNICYPKNKPLAELGYTQCTRIGFFIFIIQFLFIIFNRYYGLNIAGAEIDISASPVVLRYFFVILNPDIFFLIYACKSANNNLFKVNCVIYLSSTILRGWSGGVVFLFLIFLCRSNTIKIGLKVILLCCLLILISPFIMEIKWFIRSNGMESANLFSTIHYSEALYQFFEYLVYRLQQLTNVIFLTDRVGYFSLLYQQNEIVPYWGEILGLKNIYQASYPNALPLGQWLGGSIENTVVSWNSNPGLAGWIILLSNYSLISAGLAILVVIVSLFFNIYFSSLIGGEVLKRFSYVFCILYLFPGWMGMYINLLFYFVIWLVICKFLRVK
ncbi:oligosaccharide repeat unit polymerase [Citrobacter portucalensis]|uniref:oligosaccharide repeat unit polymerase n=1 Tax=Citrobacter portucalensis TaxID=1639133 RepID=UPI002DBD670D|nr:oligosaccharide repeat unit polymerase [Citrobacter portucalensis]MEB7575339.1 oligosaccharide repeat unit polymerase [Citrobacter portucalensis]